MTDTTPLARGEYKNPLGAVLHVTGAFSGDTRTRVLGGGIYRAESRDDLFGTTDYLVTRQTMDECGYKLIAEAEHG